MPRWNPIPSALCQEQPTDVADPPTENRKPNGYIFKRDVESTIGGYYRPQGETRYIPKVCRALPLYPKTYGLSCDRQGCQHCHPETAANFPGTYNRPSNWWIRCWYDRYYYGYSSFHWPVLGTCLVGRRGCKPHKMIRIRPAKSEGVAKNETRRRAARTEQAVEEEQDEKKRDKTQRLSKWETSMVRRIDEGCELAMSEDVVLPTDDWEAEAGDVQLAILASLGLLDDYEAEDADITLNSLPWNEDLYTIRYKPRKRKPNIRRDPEQGGVPILDDNVDWELVLGSPSEGSMSWIVLDE